MIDAANSWRDNLIFRSQEGREIFVQVYLLNVLEISRGVYPLYSDNVSLNILFTINIIYTGMVGSLAGQGQPLVDYPSKIDKPLLIIGLV